MAVQPYQISYKDRDNNPQVVTYDFNLDASEIAELRIAHKSDLPEYLDRMIKSENGDEVVIGFRSILSKAVGRREGMRLVKSQDIIDEFMQTGQYNAMFLELIGRPDSGAGFITSIMPQDLLDKHAAPESYSDEQLLAMSRSEFERVAGRDERQMDQRMLGIAWRRKEIAAQNGENRSKKNKKRNHPLPA